MAQQSNPRKVAAVIAKTRGGVPLDPKARKAFYDSEIARHNDLLKKYPIEYGPNGKITEKGKANQSKADQIVKNRDFLIQQSSAFESQMKNKQKAQQEASKAKAQKVKESQRREKLGTMGRVAEDVDKFVKDLAGGSRVF